MVELKSHPALVIIDMQNGFCHAQGTFGKMGMDVQNHRDIIPTINQLRAGAHAAGIPVFFTRLGYSEDYSDSGVIFENLTAIMDLKGFIRGTWDADIIDELKPDAKSEIVIDKTRNTGFYRTDLERQLRDRNVNQLLFTGVGTNVCVESTVRDAITIDFSSRTISDATATLTTEERDASLKNLFWFGGVISSQEALEALAKQK